MPCRVDAGSEPDTAQLSVEDRVGGTQLLHWDSGCKGACLDAVQGRLDAILAAVRHATCSRDLVILVGGPMFIEHPDWVARLGSEAMTMDGREAPVLAERLISGFRGQRDMHG